MRVRIEGRDLPGRAWCGMENIHVAVQVRSEPFEPVPGDAPDAVWDFEVQLKDGDWRGPAVHGRKGERFLYLTWGNPTDDGWDMFRRAKLMARDVDPALVEQAEASGRPLIARLALTDDKGSPRCAAQGHVEWTLTQ